MGVTRISDWRQSFDAIIDVRSPAEFEDDHIPGAVSLPALSNEERAEVGTLYKQHSAFEARKIGAALVSRNLARHIETYFMDKPGGFRPLIYCWRGGQRSGSVAIVLAEIGFLPHTLEGGYKRYRQDVMTQLETDPARFRFRIVAGQTGTGKTRFLEALAAAGGQVLDLEGLANHKGSMFGLRPGDSQPSPRSFDSRLAAALRGFDPARPVWVESESPKIGQLFVPQHLHHALRGADSIRLSAPIEARVAHSIADYQDWFDQPDAIRERLQRLTYRHGHEVIGRWLSLLDARDWQGLVRALLVEHYDPAYAGSASAYGWDQGEPLVLSDLSPARMEKAARDTLDRFS